MSSEIIDFARNYGVWGIGFMFAMALLYRYATTRLELMKVTAKASDAKEMHDYSDLKSHHFFSNAQFRLMVEIPTLEIYPEKKVRQRLWRDMLYRKIKVVHDKCLQCVEREDMSEWTAQEWANEITYMMGQITQEFEALARKDGIPEIVIEKFNRWRAPSTSSVYDYINVLASSKIYDTNLLRMNTFLTIMNLMLITALGDGERTLKELNGEISGLLYKNEPIED